jgi:hypothetical protein
MKYYIQPKPLSRKSLKRGICSKGQLKLPKVVMSIVEKKILATAK